MTNGEFGRRDFLKMGLAAGAGLAAMSLSRPAAAAMTTVSLDQCQAMTPEAMAEASGPVTNAWREIRNQTELIFNPRIRTTVQAILGDPSPSFMRGMGPKERKAVHAELTAKGYTKASAEEFLPALPASGKTPQPFLSAPGSGYGSHHAYPGGVVTHTALNVRVSNALYEGYRDVYDYLLDRDIVIASQLLHDLHKPWVFQWGKDGVSRTEQGLAGTGEHHVLGVAESMARGLPAELCVAQACAHNHPRTPEDEAQVVGWLRAAAIIVGQDPVRLGVLEPGGRTLPLPRRQEGFVCHLGDHDWVLTVPAMQWLLPVLQDMAVSDYGMSRDDLAKRPFSQFRNYVLSQATIMGLYEIYASRGKDEVARTVHSIVRPA